MSNQVYASNIEIYPRVESARFLIDKSDNKRIVMEGPHNLGDLLQLKSLGTGSYEDPEVMKFRSPAEIIVDDLITTKGGLLTNDGTTATELLVGANGEILKANSATADGIEWVEQVINKGGILTSNGTNTTELTVGTNRNILQTNSSATNGIEWTDNVLLTTLQVDNQIKTNNINPIGAGPIYIDGTGINIFSPSNNVEVHCGDVTGAPPTNQALFHVEGNGDSGIIITAGDDGTGEPYFEMQGENRSIIGNIQVDSTTDDFIFEASTLSSKAKNDIIFKTGGQFATIPALDDLAVPVGGVNSMTIDGANSNVNILNKLTFTGGVVIGDSTSSANSSDDICIGKGCISNTGSRSIGIGNGSAPNGQDSICIGTNTNTNFTGGVAIGNNATSIGATRGYAIGDGSAVTASDAWAIGRNVSNSTSSSAKLFDNTISMSLSDSLFYASTVVSAENLYSNNASSYSLPAEIVVNGRLRNAYNSGVIALTFPSRANIFSRIVNVAQGTPAIATITLHSTFKTTIINDTAQTMTLTLGANQVAIGTSISSGVPANSVVVFESYLTLGQYITYKVSTQTI